MTTTQSTSKGAASNTSRDVSWWAVAPDAAAARLQIDPLSGLSRAGAQGRLAQHGPNALAEARREPVWRQFFKQYRQSMQILLVVAVWGSVLIGGSGTAAGLTLLRLCNAWLDDHKD